MVVPSSRFESQIQMSHHPLNKLVTYHPVTQHHINRNGDLKVHPDVCPKTVEYPVPSLAFCLPTAHHLSVCRTPSQEKI